MDYTHVAPMGTEFRFDDSDLVTVYLVGTTTTVYVPIEDLKSLAHNWNEGESEKHIKFLKNIYDLLITVHYWGEFPSHPPAHQGEVKLETRRLIKKIEDKLDVPPEDRCTFPEDKPECDHEWVDARNEVVMSGEMCPKCNAIRAGNQETDGV